MVSSSSVWGRHPRAGAAEPGIAGAAEPGFNTTVNDETVLRVAYYNVGIVQEALETKHREKAKNRLLKLSLDIAYAFTKHRLDILCVCELGEHGKGLLGDKHFECDTQYDLLALIVKMVNDECRRCHAERAAGGASEPVVQVQLMSGRHPTYAVFRRLDSKLTVDDVLFHEGLDMRTGNRLDRTMITLKCKWMKKPIKISNCHCPSSSKRPWDLNVRNAVLPNVFRHAGLVPFDNWVDGSAERTPWILGGDLNIGQTVINDEMKNTSHPKAGDT